MFWAQTTQQNFFKDFAYSETYKSNNLLSSPTCNLTVASHIKNRIKFTLYLMCGVCGQMFSVVLSGSAMGGIRRKGGRYTICKDVWLITGLLFSARAVSPWHNMWVIRAKKGDHKFSLSGEKPSLLSAWQMAFCSRHQNTRHFP